MAMAEAAAHEVPGIVQAGDIDDDAALRLDRWMASAIPGHVGPLRIERFAGGQSNPTFRIGSPARDYVLRRKPPGKLLRSAHAIDREYRVMAALGREGFPVPKVYGLCQDDAVIGSAFYLMELAEGRILWDPKLPKQRPADRATIYQAQIDTLVPSTGSTLRRSGSRISDAGAITSSGNLPAGRNSIGRRTRPPCRRWTALRTGWPNPRHLPLNRGSFMAITG